MDVNVIGNLERELFIHVTAVSRLNSFHEDINVMEPLLDFWFSVRASPVSAPDLETDSIASKTVKQKRRSFSKH